MITYRSTLPKKMLQAFLDDLPAHDTTIKLGCFTNDVVPDPSQDSTQFTLDPNLGTAGVVTFTFNPPNLDENGQYHILKAAAALLASADAGPLFGYVVILEGDNPPVPWLAERFVTPITVPDGDTLYVSPELVLPDLTGEAIIDY